MVFLREKVINTPIDKAWAILGHDFAHPFKWLLQKHSTELGKPIQSTQCDERACKTVMGNIKEKLSYYSDEDYHLSYIVIEGMPGMVQKATNDWNLTKLNESQTLLRITMEFALQGWIGSLMKPMMKFKLNLMANDLIEDFAYYAENGIPHPRKLKAIKNYLPVKDSHK